MVAFIATLIAMLAAAQGAHAAAPAGFIDEVIATVPSPTALAFTPDGRLLIATQSGTLRVWQQGALLATAALDLGPILCTNSERGLLGVATDPAFAANRYIYLFYTFNKSASCAQNAATSPVNRVSRFTLSDANIVSRSSELVLIDNIPSPNGNHNGGDLHIGRDGFLYVSVGDGGCDYRGDSGCAGANDAARDQHVLLGKILRVTTGGSIPPGNPFVGSDSVRCHTAGRANPGQKCQETFAWGLRNPFRLAFDPNAPGTRFFINDVGQNTWEEINEGKAGADYGWSLREGHCAAGSTSNCGTPPGGMINPVFDYAHADGCASITGGAFVPRGAWSPAYDNAYLFSDYVCGAIFRLAPNGDGTYTRSTFVSGLGSSSAVSLRFGSAGGSQALYYTTYAAGGQVRRIRQSSNRAPVAVATATPSSGAVPLTVRLDASGSADADGDPLTYSWTFGDGSAAAAGAAVTHAYAAAGRYVATVSVRDGRGGEATASVTIDAGNAAPAPSIASPSVSAHFSVGQTVTLIGSASDREDGTLPAARLTWTVLLHHNTHTHPFFGPAAGNNLTFQAPAPEDLAATSTSHLEVILTATDSRGASATIRQLFRPRLVNITLDSQPSGLLLTVNGTAVTTPRALVSWANYRLTVAAATQTDSTGSAWLFSSWSNGGAASHTATTPSSAASLTATFARAAVTRAAADAYVRAGSYANQNFGTATALVVKESATADLRRRTLVRFPVSAGTVGRVVLRLHGALSGSGEVPIAIHPVTNTAWSETSVTWNTQPAAGTALGTAPVAAGSARWIEWDVTSHVRGELAAGRTAVAFMVASPVQANAYPVFVAREATTHRPELLISSEGPAAAGDVVLYTSNATDWSGGWRAVSDSSGAGGQRMAHPDTGAAKLTSPLASPAHFVELTFAAERGRAYRLWMRGKADRNTYENDSVYVQFSGAVTGGGLPAFRIGTSTATTYTLEDCSGCGVSGWGWQDNGFGLGVKGPLIYFEASGPQRIRIQTREDGLSIDQVVLSPATFLDRAPGALTGDTTVLPKP